MIRAVLFRPYRAWALHQLRRFAQSTQRVREIQREVLFARISRNRDTSFGRDHGFAGIATVEDFRAQVPVASYEYYERYIDRLKAGDTGAMLGGDQKLVMFALTSGTHSARKFIPITEDFVREFRRSWLIWGVKAAFDHPGMLLGSVVQLTSDWDEFRTASGVPCGSVSGLVTSMQRKIVRKRYAVPSEVARIKDITARHYTTLRLAIPRSVSLMTTANPSTLVNLARLGDAEKESLVRDIADGTLSSRFAVPRDVRQKLRKRIGHSDRHRARELDRIIARTGTLLPKDYWPRLILLGNWMGGSVGAYLRHYPSLFGSTPVRDVGLVASEGRMTIPLESGTTAGVLDPTTNYYEFIPEEEGDSENPTVLEAHELAEGKSYFILLTTPSGFYRYNISDLVRVVGRYHETPVLEFLNRGSHFASITGEKLSESHVTRAVDRALGELSLALTAFTVAPCWDDLLPYYTLLVERPDIPSAEVGRRLIERVDLALCQHNTEYESKRETKRLGPVRLGLLPGGTWRKHFRSELERTGGAAEQYKHRCLVNDWEFIHRLPVEGQLSSDSAAEIFPMTQAI